MKENFKTSSSTVNKFQILVGVAVLFVGALVYLIDRPPGQTYFIYKSSINISLHSILPNLFGIIGNSLPAFIHVFSLILMTAGIISCRKSDYLIICVSWFIVDCTFELGQKFSTWSVKLIPDWFTEIPFLENSQNCFLQGTFDILDLAAIALGTVAAYLMLLTTNRRKQRHGERKE